MPLVVNVLGDIDNMKFDLITYESEQPLNGETVITPINLNGVGYD